MCVLRISGLYTSRLLDAASKKVLNLLKKGLLKVEATLKSAWTEKDQIDNLLKERRLMRSLEKFVGGRLYEGDLRLRQKNHMILSYDVLIIQNIRVNSFTMKMEILLEPTSNKLMVERFYTSAGNPVKEIFLKLNLPDHMSILMDSKVTPTKHGRMTKPYSSPRFIANCFNAGYLKMVVKVRIYQISQENRQERANTDTRTEERARTGSQSQKVKPWSTKVNH
ncbi:hypothetical protein Tco_0468470 [Tanacetum coccineum]